MRRLVVLAAGATLAFAAVSAEAAPPGFRYGVAAGEITSTSAVLWTRAPKPGPVSLGLLPERRGARLITVLGLRATRAADLAVQLRVPRLEPGTRYRYVFEQGETTSPFGTFVTAPRGTADRLVRFAITGDADATPGTNGKPAYNSFGVYARMAAEKNDFNINLGDTIYSDSEVGGAQAATTVAQKWGKY